MSRATSQHTIIYNSFQNPLSTRASSYDFQRRCKNNGRGIEISPQNLKSVQKLPRVVKTGQYISQVGGRGKPRCGVPDPTRLQKGYKGEPPATETRDRQRRYSVDWTRWNKNHLTYRWVLTKPLRYRSP